MATGFRAEVTVRGGGVFGLACAWEIARRGAKVRLIETARLGAGSSGGLVGMLAPHVPDQWNPKKQFQFEALALADAFWAAVAAAGGRDPGYARTGRLQPLDTEAAVTLARARGAEAAVNWQGLARWSVARAEDFGPMAPVSATGLVVHDTLSGRADPRAAGAALAAAITARGGQIVLGDAEDEGAVIHATGVAGLAALSAAFAREVGNGVKGQSASLGIDMGDAPQVFHDGVLIVPHANGTVALGSTSERVFDSPDTTDHQLEEIIAKARMICPALADAPVIERWAGVRPRARTMAPMLGAWPGRAGQFVANGGFKIGFGMAPKVAEVMADLVLEGRDAIPEGMRVEDCL
ncbi:FAD-dependent oxidoreductase [Rhodobacter veldkampii DSM 11550]|uniref:FAD-dependent oxidoreductase n=1 Tax=Phaeovulum veldkampii DSM 11550 TaxID=1185920 RepID=A0A2T4JBD4_9RHOB|nr:FAD-binding oxidoreductase [Phaeovulum veldkampii]MBK5946712.1 FAD-dependent oxidoreductase [Phaeovulum veldkampii DSM 11550]NCU20190.1 FAD-binding oxidoreductase [Candidatus Falkowbacteria bacterium]PTE15201.1 FAD-dependent oxidoreductase [Phaeovulum veldkampii DSM 11550]TDQ59253.1 glycine/D-amino acid oxidase-like deaminating enzyme [Phaeovulum veldkampii DSM 11550]